MFAGKGMNRAGKGCVRAGDGSSSKKGFLMLSYKSSFK